MAPSQQGQRRETPSRQHDATDSSHLSIGEILLSRQRLEQLAQESKTILRKPRKLDPCDFRGYRRVLVQDSTIIKLPAGEMRRHCAAGAHFIYRHKTGMI
jgi:hypothetical protein